MEKAKGRTGITKERQSDGLETGRRDTAQLMRLLTKMGRRKDSLSPRRAARRQCPPTAGQGLETLREEKEMTVKRRVKRSVPKKVLSSGTKRQNRETSSQNRELRRRCYAFHNFSRELKRKVLSITPRRTERPLPTAHARNVCRSSREGRKIERPSYFKVKVEKEILEKESPPYKVLILENKLLNTPSPARVGSKGALGIVRGKKEGGGE